MTKLDLREGVVSCVRFVSKIVAYMRTSHKAVSCKAQSRTSSARLPALPNVPFAQKLGQEIVE